MASPTKETNKKRDHKRAKMLLRRNRAIRKGVESQADTMQTLRQLAKA